MLAGLSVSLNYSCTILSKFLPLFDAAILNAIVHLRLRCRYRFVLFFFSSFNVYLIIMMDEMRGPNVNSRLA